MKMIRQSKSSLKIPFPGKGTSSLSAGKGANLDEISQSQDGVIKPHRRSLAESLGESFESGNPIKSDKTTSKRLEIADCLNSSPMDRLSKPKAWLSALPFRAPNKDQTREQTQDLDRGSQEPPSDAPVSEAADKFTIALLGPSGSGKSSFIAHATGQNVKIGHFLSACTESIDAYEMPVNDNKVVVFLDTPGYDLADKNPNRVLNMLTQWLKAQYAEGRRINLNAILFFHRITDNRMPIATQSHINKFEKLIGKKAAPRRILLVTTMWDEIDDFTGQKREEQLQREFWRRLIEGGSSIHRFTRCRSSAWTFLKPLIGVAVEECPLPNILDSALQEEPEEDQEIGSEEALRTMEQIFKDHRRLLDRLQAIVQQPSADQVGALREVLVEEKRVSGKLASLVGKLKRQNPRGFSGLWRGNTAQHD